MIGIKKTHHHGWYIKSGTIYNEIEAYKRMKRFVPEYKINGDIIYIKEIIETPVINKVKFMSNYERVINELERNGIEHGDLTMYNILASNDEIYIIDFAESRFDRKGKLKRPEGDRYWLLKAMLYKCNGDAVNSRADDMFYHVYNELRQMDIKTITDYGCGHGDMSLKAMSMGYSVLPTDNEIHTDKIVIVKCDIEKVTSTTNCAFCFAVLPYLKDADKFLNNMSKNHQVSFIEWQYNGDGPGTLTKDEVQKKLNSIFKSTKIIGDTYVEGRNCYRDIWMCK